MNPSVIMGVDILSKFNSNRLIKLNAISQVTYKEVLIYPKPISEITVQ